MFVLISYDVCTNSEGGPRRLRRVSRICENYGQRVQNSVFECIVDPAMFESLKQKLLVEINKEKDSLRFYFLGANWKRRIEHVGAKATIDVEDDPLIC